MPRIPTYSSIISIPDQALRIGDPKVARLSQNFSTDVVVMIKGDIAIVWAVTGSKLYHQKVKETAHNYRVCEGCQESERNQDTCPFSELNYSPSLFKSILQPVSFILNYNLPISKVNHDPSPFKSKLRPGPFQK